MKMCEGGGIGHISGFGGLTHLRRSKTAPKMGQPAFLVVGRFVRCGGSTLLSVVVVCPTLGAMRPALTS